MSDVGLNQSPTLLTWPRALNNYGSHNTHKRLSFLAIIYHISFINKSCRFLFKVEQLIRDNGKYASEWAPQHGQVGFLPTNYIYKHKRPSSEACKTRSAVESMTEPLEHLGNQQLELSANPCHTFPVILGRTGLPLTGIPTCTTFLLKME